MTNLERFSSSFKSVPELTWADTLSIYTLVSGFLVQYWYSQEVILIIVCYFRFGREEKKIKNFSFF